MDSGSGLFDWLLRAIAAVAGVTLSLWGCLRLAGFL
jgi:hypothetical protein